MLHYLIVRQPRSYPATCGFDHFVTDATHKRKPSKGNWAPFFCTSIVGVSSFPFGCSLRSKRFRLVSEQRKTGFGRASTETLATQLFYAGAKARVQTLELYVKVSLCQSIRICMDQETPPGSYLGSACEQNSGAPNENIVQNHLNIELLNVF